ncbi:MAG: 4Fe-4S binding protein [Holosporaceae bacterium]|nr:4Fe-4S binding protein [Holosporaceae bacterium]
MKVICEKCTKCLDCMEVCAVNAITRIKDEIVINNDACLGCGCCVSMCPHDAIEYE